MNKTHFLPIILLIDDDHGVLSALQRSFHRLRPNWAVIPINNPLHTVKILEIQTPDFIITDQCMPGLQGTDILASLHNLGIRIPSLVLSGQINDLEAHKARKLGADLLPKPAPVEMLISHIEDSCAYPAPMLDISNFDDAEPAPLMPAPELDQPAFDFNDLSMAYEMEAYFRER